MLKTMHKLLLVFAMFMMSSFIAVGYAALTDQLAIHGEAHIEVPEGLFITNVEVISASNVDDYYIELIPYSTTLEVMIDKKNDTVSGGGWWGGQTITTYTGTLTLEITVLNNTQYEYAYRKLYYQKSDRNNSEVATSASSSKIGVVPNIPNNFIIESARETGETETFTVTYTIGKSLDDEKEWKTLLNYQFGINVDSIDLASEIVHDKFLNILNSASTYETLYDVLDDKFDGNQEWTSNYVGNVGNAINNDMMTVETLFAGQLTMLVNGNQQQAWVIIKHENLDGNELTGDDYTVRFNQYGDVTYRGCEMTLYMTVDDLNERNGWAPVYTTVFTCDRDANGNKISSWYKVGDTYYGEANIVGYNGESGQTGSFVTDNWKSFASSYQVTDDYSYSIGSEISIKSLMQEVDQSTINEFQNLLVRSEQMIANDKYAGTGIRVVEDAYSKAAAFYTKNANGNAIANSGTRRVQLIPIMNELDHVLSIAQAEIDRLEQGN